jgi:ribonuclease HI
MSQRTQIFTDGACSGNPGPGGWAWIIPYGNFASGNVSQTTNQRMELTAAYEAVLQNQGPIEIVSDSTYVVKCFNDEWWKGWLKRGWKNSQRKPVANRDLWEPFIEEYQQRDVIFTWVKGHAGNEWNDFADQLAVEAGYLQQTREGSEPPSEIILP